MREETSSQPYGERRCAGRSQDDGLKEQMWSRPRPMNLENGNDMTQRRILMIGLDGFDICLAERFLDEGALPNFARLRDRSMRFDLDHGVDKYSGLAWEHVSAGQAPNDGARWSAVTFDPGTYVACQEPTSSRPFLADVSARTVVFDVPYCDLDQAPASSRLNQLGIPRPRCLTDVSSGRPSRGTRSTFWALPSDAMDLWFLLAVRQEDTRRWDGSDAGG